MRVLVTGGAGFIGSHTVDALVEEGHKVIVVDNLSTGKRENVNRWADFILDDIKSPSFSLEGVDAVIHLAAQINVRRSIDDPILDAEENIIGSLRLWNHCIGHDVKKLVFASSGGTVYGNQEVLPVGEDAKTHPISPYGISKLSTEYYLRFIGAKTGIHYTILRYGNVYGPRQDDNGEAGVIAAFIRAKLEDRKPKIWGDGNQTRDFVYVADVVEANLAAMHYMGTEKVFNIGTGIETSINEVYHILFGGIPDHVPFDESLKRISLDPDLARKHLGWVPIICVDEGMRRTIGYEGSRSNPGI